jgi:two-component system OmpR family sensor kinase
MGAAAEPEKTAQAMRRIEDEAERMGVLVEDLLALARLDEAPERERQIVDLAAIARDAVDDARATAPDRAISLDAADSANLLADPLQLQQVLANLLRNALVHTPTGTPIELAVGERSGTVTLSVRDHGPGIPPAARERLFERFWRAESGRERGRAGAGLGLAIASAIVEAHNGSISVHEAPGGGALFLVEIPAPAPELLAARPT